MHSITTINVVRSLSVQFRTLFFLTSTERFDVIEFELKIFLFFVFSVVRLFRRDFSSWHVGITGKNRMFCYLTSFFWYLEANGRNIFQGVVTVNLLKKKKIINRLWSIHHHWLPLIRGEGQICRKSVRKVFFER